MPIDVTTLSKEELAKVSHESKKELEKRAKQEAEEFSMKWSLKEIYVIVNKNGEIKDKVFVTMKEAVEARKEDETVVVMRGHVKAKKKEK